MQSLSGTSATSSPGAGINDEIYQQKAKIPAWTPLPAGPDETVYEGFGLRTRPAPMEIVPRLSEADVLKHPEVVAFTDEGYATGVPDVELCLITSGDFPPGGENVDKVVDQLGWVLIYHESPVTFFGPHPPELPQQYADFIIIIDASTSAYIAGVQTSPKE